MYVDRHDGWRWWLFPEGQPRRRMGEFPRRVAGDGGGDDVKISLALLLALLVAACSDAPKDGRYQTGGGGWDNFRADAAALAVHT